MGLSGGGSSTSVSGSAQKWAKPYAKAAAGTVQGVFDANQGSLQGLTDTVQGTVPGLSNNFEGWNPSVGQSQDYYGDVLGGKFLDPSSNPGLESVLGRMRGDVSDEVNSQFSLGGRYGSGAHTGVLTDRLADAEGNILYGNYNAERSRQDAAAGAAPQAQNQSLAALLQAAGVGAELPYTGANNLASGLSALFSGGTQTQKGPGILGQIIGAVGQVGAGAAQAGAFGSDRRLKKNIQEVGRMDDGLTVYEYDYVAAPNDEIASYMPEGRQRGVMADDVVKLRPWALGPEIGGYATVNYGAL